MILWITVPVVFKYGRRGQASGADDLLFCASCKTDRVTEIQLIANESETGADPTLLSPLPSERKAWYDSCAMRIINLRHEFRQFADADPEWNNWTVSVRSYWNRDGNPDAWYRCEAMNIDSKLRILSIDAKVFDICRRSFRLSNGVNRSFLIWENIRHSQATPPRTSRVSIDQWIWIH